MSELTVIQILLGISVTCMFIALVSSIRKGKKMPGKPVQVHIVHTGKKKKKNQWYFQFKINGRILATGRGYDRKSSAVKGAEAITSANQRAGFDWYYDE